MKIIPAINCQDFDCVKNRLEKSVEFGANWVQIDIADGKFTKHKTWNNSEELQELRIKNYELSKLNIEAHLMVENPLKEIKKWAKTGAKRIIIHIEALKNYKIERLKDCEIGLALNPSTSVENLIPYLATIDGSKKFVQLLAVDPGLSGQKFQPKILEKIKFIKQNYPDVVVEIDGGINLEISRLCREAGADILVAGSYIWNAVNPSQAYKELTR